MSDNNLNVATATLGNKVLRSRDTGSDIQAQRVDVSPWLPTVAASADNQYAVTVAATAVTLTVPSGFTHALISVDGATVRFTEDGSTPTSTNGVYFADGSIAEVPLPNALKFIAVSGTAKLNVSYRKYI